MSTKESDFVVDLFVATNHTLLLIFTDAGKVYSMKVYDLPMAGRTARGKPIINLIPTEKGERVQSILPIREFLEDSTLLMATRRGIVRRTATKAFAKIRQTGIRAIVLAEGDDLISVRELPPEHYVLLATKNGLSIRFPGDSLRILGRTTMGVRGIALRDGDEVVGVGIIPDDEVTILTVTSNGFGKRTPAEEYRVQGRAGMGIITIKVNERNGYVVGAMMVEDEHELMLVTDFGKIIRTPVREISVIGRNTQGVTIINLEKGERVVAVERMAEREEEEVEEEAEELPTSTRFHSSQLLRKDIMSGPEEDDDVDGESEDLEGAPEETEDGDLD